MPVKAAEEIDRAAIAKAGAWALEYVLDPKRGAGKRFPTKEEVHAQFPDLKLTSIEQVENWVFQKVGSTNLESISHDPQKIEEVLKETKKQEGQEHKRETVLSPASLSKAASTTLVLEEIDTVLGKHKNQTAEMLTADLTPQVKSFITAIAPKGLSAQQVDQLTAQIAQEVSRETLENIPKVVDMSQAPDVIADSLVSTVLVEPALIPNPQKQNIGKLLEKAAPLASQIATTHQQDLEKVAVLSNISRISQLEKLSPQVQEVIDLKVSQTLKSQHPLATRTETAALSGNLKSYLQSYAQDFKDALAKESGAQIPSFAQFQKVQGEVHQKSSRLFSEQVAGNLGSQAKTLTSRVNLAQFPDELADALRLRPFTRDQLERLGLGSAQPKLNTFTKAAPGLANWGTGIALATNTNFQTQAYWTAMTASGHLPQQAKKLAAEDKGLEAELKLKGSLPYPKAKRYNVVQTQLGVIASAEKFKAKNPRRYQTFVSWHNSLPSRQRLGWVSATSQAVTDAYFGDQHLFVPRLALARHPNQFLANRTFGAMAHGLGNFTLGNLLSISLGSSRSAFGMGKGLIAKSTPQAIIASKAAGIMGRIAKVTGGVFLGFGIYFAMLGKAALTGFLMGAAIGFGVGAGAGAVIGFQIGVALAPFTFGLSIPFFTLAGAAIGGFVGGTIGGIAGGLIGYGMAAGSTTAVSTGVGAGVGGTVGTYVGATAGATAGTAVGTALATVFPPLAPLIPVFTLTGMAMGGVIGGYLGTLIGAGIGYAAGKVLSSITATIGAPATSAAAGATIGFVVGGPLGALIGAGIGYLLGGGWAQIKAFLTAAPSTSAVAFGGLMSTAASALSSVFGGIMAAGGGILGGLASAAGGLVGALSSIAIPSGLAAISVGSGVFGIIAVGTIVGITTAATFFNPEVEQQPGGIIAPGDASIGNWPTDGWVTQGPEGNTSHYRISNPSMDIANDIGTPVYSTINGFVDTVYYCAPNNSCDEGLGNYVVLRDAASTFTIWYGHLLANIAVSEGDVVTPDTKLGEMNETGNVFGSHLHWEFHNLALAPPNIPAAITPANCDTPEIPCSPPYVTRDPNFNARQYWFLLHRKTDVNATETEGLYLGIPGDPNNSELLKTYTVNTGIPFDDPTPLPQLVGMEYWLINGSITNPGGTMGPYFITLNIPFDDVSPLCNNPDPLNPNGCNGPVPYNECGPARNQQCYWTLGGNFGLHGTNGSSSRLTDSGSSGCIRHSDADITEIYNTIQSQINSGQIRYYVTDN